MLVMARKKKPQTESEQDQSRAMGFRPSPAMRAVIEKLADKERRKPAQMLLILVEDALAARGLWPAKQGG